MDNLHHHSSFRHQTNDASTQTQHPWHPQRHSGARPTPARTILADRRLSINSSDSDTLTCNSASVISSTPSRPTFTLPPTPVQGNFNLITLVPRESLAASFAAGMQEVSLLLDGTDFPSSDGDTDGDRDDDNDNNMELIPNPSDYTASPESSTFSGHRDETWDQRVPGSGPPVPFESTGTSGYPGVEIDTWRDINMLDGNEYSFETGEGWESMPPPHVAEPASWAVDGSAGVVMEIDGQGHLEGFAFEPAIPSYPSRHPWNQMSDYLNQLRPTNNIFPNFPVINPPVSLSLNSWSQTTTTATTTMATPLPTYPYHPSDANSLYPSSSVPPPPLPVAMSMTTTTTSVTWPQMPDIPLPAPAISALSTSSFWPPCTPRPFSEVGGEEGGQKKRRRMGESEWV